jgi:hypothetical protein
MNQQPEWQNLDPQTSSSFKARIMPDRKTQQKRAM